MPASSALPLVAGAPLAFGQEPATGRLRAVGPGYPPADRVSRVVGPDAVQQLGGAVRAQRLPVVPALQTFLAGTTIMLDPAGALYAAIGAGNLRAYTQGQDDVGHAALGN